VPHLSLDQLLPFLNGRPFRARTGPSGAEIDVPVLPSGKRPLHGCVVTDRLPSREQTADVAKAMACPHCHAAPCILVTCHDDGTIVVALIRCTSCLKPIVLIFTLERDASGCIVMLGNPKSREYRQQFSEEMKCNCGAAVDTPNLDLDSFRYKVLLPFKLQCRSCGKTVLGTFMQSPRQYFEHDIAISRTVRASSPAASWVFCIAAMETFLQKAFAFEPNPPFNLFLVDTRKVDFQSQAAKDVYAAHFGVDLPALAGTHWQELVEASRKRNYIVHNNGHDKSMNEVVIEPDDVVKVEALVTAFIAAVERELILRGLC
jgi:hypothetical protein